MNLFAELKRRNVIRMAGLYLVGAWLFIQVAETLLPIFGTPEWVLKALVMLLALGFVPAVVFSWLFELTPEGLKRDADVNPVASLSASTGRRMDRLIAIGLVLVLLAFAADRFWPKPAANPAAVATAADPVAPLPATIAPTTTEVADTTASSIAVLPFANLSSDPEQEFFSDGMAEEILNALTRIKDLRVLGRSSSFQFKGKNVPPQTVGRELGVAHLLTGSVRKQGDRLRISVALIRSSDGVQQWSKQYDGKLTDVFDLQDSCARDIASELKIALAGGTESRLVDKATDNPEAYAKFIEAQDLVTRRVGDSLPRAIRLLNEATTLDPAFARAWAKLAVAHAVVVQYVGGDWQENWQASDQAAARALELDPESTEAYAVTGYNNLARRKYMDMDAASLRALALDSGDITANFWRCNQLSSMGRFHESDQRIDRALERDPDNPLLLFYKGIVLWSMGDYENAVLYTRRAEALGYPLSRLVLAYEKAKRGDVAAGAELYASGMSALGTKIPHADIKLIFAGAYQEGEPRQQALAAIERNPGDEYTPTFLIMLGEPDRAFRSFENGSSGLTDAFFDWLWQQEDWSRHARQHPSFQGFAQRMGMVEYWKRYGWPDLCAPAPEKGPEAFTCR
ncbi:tetratricopeptide repeat protein [Dokdonella sp.]|uniref:tetratricopeptide repeat protein n=1 Tax=Dokdonella sp. TaxID=2291710 RepID=UPI003C3EE10F